MRVRVRVWVWVWVDLPMSRERSERLMARMLASALIPSSPISLPARLRVCSAGCAAVCFTGGSASSPADASAAPAVSPSVGTCPVVASAVLETSPLDPLETSTPASTPNPRSPSPHRLQSRRTKPRRVTTAPKRHSTPAPSPTCARVHVHVYMCTCVCAWES